MLHASKPVQSTWNGSKSTRSQHSLRENTYMNPRTECLLLYFPILCTDTKKAGNTLGAGDSSPYSRIAVYTTLSTRLFSGSFMLQVRFLCHFWSQQWVMRKAQDNLQSTNATKLQYNTDLQAEATFPWAMRPYFLYFVCLSFSIKIWLFSAWYMLLFLWRNIVSSGKYNFIRRRAIHLSSIKKLDTL